MLSKREWIIYSTGVLFVLICGLALHGQAPPKTLPDAAKWKLLSLYQKAIMAQSALNQAVGAFNAATEEERKAQGYPEGTRFDVKLDQDQVLVVTPPEPPKPADVPKNPAAKPESPK